MKLGSYPVHNRRLISIQRPYLWLLSLLVIIAVLVLAFLMTFEYGRQAAGFVQSDTDEQIAFLQQQIVDLSERNDDLLRQNAKLVRGHNIDKDAGSQVNRTLADAQSQILEMKEELTFYRSIVTPNKSKRSIVVKKVQLVAESAGRYKYKVVLIQDGRQDVAVRGQVEFSFEGEQVDGTVVRLDLPTVSVKKTSKRQKFGFKYFQNFEGSIRIPEDFTPITMFVRVLPSSSRVPRVEEVLAWDDILSGGE
ncbi:MAG: DUF6776 family protein [Gammaproteobacteria bacterium]